MNTCSASYGRSEAVTGLAIKCVLKHVRNYVNLLECKPIIFYKFIVSYQWSLIALGLFKGNDGDSILSLQAELEQYHDHVDICHPNVVIICSNLH